MTTKIIEYQAPIEKTYVSPDYFKAAHEESEIAISVIDGRIQFLGWDSTAYEYNTKGFYVRASHGFDIETIRELLDAYDRRV